MARVIVPSLPTRYDAATQQQVPTIDLNPAAKFGQLIVLSEHPNTVDDIDTVEIRNQEIDPTDYIMAAGDVALVGIAIAHAIKLNGRARILRWNKQRHQYDIWEV